MPIDARISMGLRPQTYDAFAAYDTGRQNEQTFRTNQMAMQAAEATATAQRNAMREARTLDPTNQEALRAYALRNPAAAEQVLGGLASADNLFSARGTAARAQTTFDTEQQAASSDALSEAIGMIVQDPSDARIAAARAAFVATGGDGAAFDAYAAPVIATDYASGARRPMVVNMIGGSPEGDRLVNRFTENYVRTNMGDRSTVDQTNPYAPGFTPPVEQKYGESPNRPQYMTGEDGTVYRVPSSGPAAPVPVEGGGNLTELVQGATPAADADRAAAATTLRDVLYQLDENFETLYQTGFMRGEGVSGIGNIAQYTRDKVPFLRGIQLAGNPAADAASGRVEALLSTAVSTLSSLYGTSSRVMDAVKEMENVRKSFGSQDIPIEAARSMIRTVFQRVAEEEFARTGTRPAPPPERGAVRDGYRYRGGNPANETSWTPVR